MDHHTPRPPLSYPATASRPTWRLGRCGVSVIVPFRRFGPGLEAAVASVWAQRGVEVEAVLVPTGAGERDILRAERLAAKGRGHVALAHVALAHAATEGEALAHGIAASTGPIVTTLDTETTLAPHKLAADVDIIAADPRAVALCDLERFGMDAPVRWSFTALDGSSGGRLTADVAARGRALPRHIAFSRALYGRTTGYDPALGGFANWALAIELTGLASAFVRTPHVGLTWSPHPRRGPAVDTMWQSALDLHLAFLKNADMLATRFGAEAVAFLRSAAETLAVSAPIREAWDEMDARATFPGHVLTDLRALRRGLLAPPGASPGPAPQARLEAAYAALTVPA